MRRRLPILLVLVGCAGAAYLLWAWQCLSAGAMMSDAGAWPRPFPYLDRWLWRLNDYYDARYPVHGPVVKLRGEIARVQVTVLTGAAIFMLAAVIGAVPLVKRWQAKRWERGFPVVGPDERK